MHYWLMKSEPNEASIDHVLDMANHTIAWYGVRNYQARNFMRDQMQIGDGVLFYHSSCPIPGIAGLAQVVSAPYPDATQFDPHSKYYDAKSDPKNPRWILVDIQVCKKTPFISLAELRQHNVLSGMPLLQRGNRLSIMPITRVQWQFINQLMQSSS